MLTFGKSHFLTKTWIGFDGLTIWGVLPHSGRLFAGFLAGAFFSEITRPWNFRPHLGDFRALGIQKRRGISPEVGYTNFQTVMFDMDPFGGKKAPCAKYQESGIIASRARQSGI